MITTASLFDEPQTAAPTTGTQISFWVPGICAPAGSKKGFWNKKANRVMIVDDCKRSKPWQSDVKAFAYEAYKGPLLKGPLHVVMDFYFTRPKAHFNSKGQLKELAMPYKVSKPDLLKTARGCEDAMTGVIYGDDSQIVIEHLTKRYEQDRGPGVEIIVREIVE